MLLKNVVLCMILVYCIFPADLAAQGQLRAFELPTSILNPVGAGARAAGKSFAFIADADDATAASHNPAGLTTLEKIEFSIVGSYFHLYEDSDGGSEIANQRLEPSSLNFVSIAVPFTKYPPIKIVTSLQMQNSFDLHDALEFQGESEGLKLKFKRDGSLFHISPAIAIGNDTFSAGIAFNIWPDIANNGWETETLIEDEGQSARSFSNFAFRGFNITAGFLWILPSYNNVAFQLGGVFRSRFNARVKHNNIERNSSALEQRAPLEEELTMKMPLSYGMGIKADIARWDLAVSMDIAWVQWSRSGLQTPDSSFFFTVGGNDVIVSPDFRNESRGDTVSVRLGFEYLLSDDPLLPLRAGFFYDPEPSREGISHFFGFSLGMGVLLEHVQFDFAYTFRTGSRTKLVIERDSEGGIGSDFDELDTTVFEHKFFASIIVQFPFSTDEDNASPNAYKSLSRTQKNNMFSSDLKIGKADL